MNVTAKQRPKHYSVYNPQKTDEQYWAGAQVCNIIYSTLSKKKDGCGTEENKWMGTTGCAAPFSKTLHVARVQLKHS